MRSATAGWLLALLGWTALLCFYDLNGGAGFEMIDCWVAQTAREMQAAGEWLIPRFAGETRMQKSPGPYWSVMLASVLRGQPVDAVSARMPSALAALVLVATIFVLTRRIAGDRAAVFAGFAASSSVLVLWWSHRAASDLGLATLTTIALAALWLGADEPPGRRRVLLFLLGYFAAGAGMLYKLPMPLAVVGAPAFFYLLLRNRWRLLASPWHLLGLLLFLLPWLPWALAAYLAEDGALLRWKVEFLDRFTGDLPNYEDRTNRVKEFFTYVTPTALYTLPFTLSLPAALYRGFRPPAGVKRDGTLFMLIWFAALLVFFTASSGKEERYFLPALPPLFVLLGIELAALFDPARPRHPVLARVAAAAIAIGLPAALLGGGLYGLQIWWARRGSLELAGAADWPDVRFAFVVTAAILIIGGWVSVGLYLRRHGNAAFGTLVATMYVLWLWTWPNLLPLVMSPRPSQDYAAQVHQAPAALRDQLRCMGSPDSRIVWYGDLRMPRVIDQFQLLREQQGRRSLDYERRRIAEETLAALGGPAPALFTARYVDFLPLVIEAPAALAREGRTMPPLHVWAQTRYGTEDQQHVLFSNQPPPFPPTGLVVPPERLRKLGEKGLTIPAELLLR